MWILNKCSLKEKDLRKFKEKYVQTADTNNTKRIVEYIMKSLEKMRGKETKI